MSIHHKKTESSQQTIILHIQIDRYTINLCSVYFMMSMFVCVCALCIVWMKNSILNCILVFIGRWVVKKNWSLIIITVPFRANLNNYDRIGELVFILNSFVWIFSDWENKLRKETKRERAKKGNEINPIRANLYNIAVVAAVTSAPATVPTIKQINYIYVWHLGFAEVESSP